MKKGTKIFLVFAAAVLVAAGATSGLILATASAQSASADATMRDDLSAQGLRVESVSQDPSTQTLNIVINSRTGGSPEDAWANAVVQREADFLAQSGALTASTVAVTMVDEKGQLIYRWSGPVESRPRPAPKAVNESALDKVRPEITQQAESRGVALNDLVVAADPAQGTTVSAKVVVSATAGAARDEQVKWATVGLLGELRDFAEGEEALGIDMYRVSISDADGSPLVEYVVDPGAKTVRAWMAPGITPVWATGRPSGEPAATTQVSGS